MHIYSLIIKWQWLLCACVALTRGTDETKPSSGCLSGYVTATFLASSPEIPFINLYVYVCLYIFMYVLQVFRIPLSLRNSWRNQDPLDGNRRIFNYRDIDGKSTSVWVGYTISFVSKTYHPV